MSGEATRARELIRLALLLALAKLLLLGLVLGAFLLWQPAFNHAGYIAVYRGNYGHPPTQPPTLATMLTAWDAQHYLRIASEGYAEPGAHRAFYPLWPLAIRATAVLTGGDLLLAALLLGNALSIVGLLLLYAWLSNRHSRTLAAWAIALLLCYPGAFFLCLPYSESLYLAVSAAAFWLMHAGRLGAACAPAMLLPLTRPVGVFVVFPLVVAAYRRHRSPRALLWALPILFGYGLYFAILAHDTGDPTAGFAIQKQFIGAPSIARLLSPVAFVQSLWHVTGLHTFRGSALDRVSFVCFFAIASTMAARMCRRGDPAPLDQWLYALPMGLVPAVSSHLMSFTRYLGVIFPVFTESAGLIERARGPLARGSVAAVMLAMLGTQVWLAVRFLTYRWAG